MSWPVKTWTVGDPLPASELNTYVRDNLNQIDPSGAVEGQILTVNAAKDGYDFTTVDTEIIKAADEVVNNSNTLQNDDDFVFALEANSRYLVSCELVLFTTGGADWKFAWVLPASAVWGGTYLDNLDASTGVWVTRYNQASGAGDSVDVSVASPGAPWLGTFVIETSATAGNAQFQWAQIVATLTDTTVRAGSRVRYRKVA